MTNINTTPKMTKAQKYALLAEIPAVANDPVLAEFVAHEMELLANKKSSPKKPTAHQTANVGILEAILAGMERNRCYTITELIKEIPECAELTNQRVSAILRPVIGSRVERVEDKRKAYFKVM